MNTIKCEVCDEESWSGMVRMGRLDYHDKWREYWLCKKCFKIWLEED